MVAGTIFDVAVDLRRDSPTFGQWDSFILSADDSKVPSQIYLPEGMAHGLATPYGPATIAYLVSSPWSPDDEKVLTWNDEELSISWPVENPQLSSRDQQGFSLDEIRNF